MCFVFFFKTNADYYAKLKIFLAIKMNKKRNYFEVFVIGHRYFDMRCQEMHGWRSIFGWPQRILRKEWEQWLSILAGTMHTCRALLPVTNLRCHCMRWHCYYCYWRQVRGPNYCWRQRRPQPLPEQLTANSCLHLWRLKQVTTMMVHLDRDYQDRCHDDWKSEFATISWCPLDSCKVDKFWRDHFGQHVHFGNGLALRFAVGIHGYKSDNDTEVFLCAL